MKAWLCYREFVFWLVSEGGWAELVTCPICNEPAVDRGCGMGLIHRTVMDFSKAVTVDESEV